MLVLGIVAILFGGWIFHILSKECGELIAMHTRQVDQTLGADLYRRYTLNSIFALVILLSGMLTICGLFPTTLLQTYSVVGVGILIVASSWNMVLGYKEIEIMLEEEHDTTLALLKHADFAGYARTVSLGVLYSWILMGGAAVLWAGM